MTEQPTPSIDQSDVDRVVTRDYGPSDWPTVKALLAQYGTEDWQREAARVQLATLKLAQGSLEQLRSWIGIALEDYRDVLAPAEYPTYTRDWSRMASLAEEDRRTIISSDWEQYQDWLHAS
jgi:hypothetical protein